jgi:hypothetical protein
LKLFSFSLILCALVSCGASTDINFSVTDFKKADKKLSKALRSLERIFEGEDCINLLSEAFNRENIEDKRFSISVSITGDSEFLVLSDPPRFEQYTDDLAVHICTQGYNYISIPISSVMELNIEGLRAVLGHEMIHVLQCAFYGVADYSNLTNDEIALLEWADQLQADHLSQMCIYGEIRY